MPKYPSVQVIVKLTYSPSATISEWEIQNPNWAHSDKGKDEYIQLVQSVMTDISDGPTENKIIKSIAKETLIDK